MVYGNGVFVVRKFWSTGGLWVSSNQGQTWSSANTGSVPDRGAYSCIAFGNGVFVRPAETGLMISSNGSTWSTITPPNVPAGFGFRGQVLHSAHSGFVLVQKVGSLPGEVEIMTASSSDGSAWSFRNTRVTTSNTGTIELGGTAGELLFVHAYESGRDLTEVWCSADHGHSWRLVEAGPWTSSINDLAYFSGNSTVLAVGTGSEIHTTDLNSFSRRLFTDEFTLRLGDGIRDGGVQGDGDYDPSTSATLTAVPNSGYRFTGWTGDASGTENPLTITMDADKTVGASFQPDLGDADGDGLSNYSEVVNPLFPALRSGHRLFQRPSHRKQIPSSNPRNAAAGSLKLLDAAVVARRGLDAVFYGLGAVEGRGAAETQAELLRWLEKLGLPVVPKFWEADDTQGVREAIAQLGKLRHDFAFETDGAVLKLDAFKRRAQVGSTAKAPRWAMAYKYEAERARTRLNVITVQVGRTGTLTPVAELEPVPIAGSRVARATLHNEEEIARKDIRIGDWVFVEQPPFPRPPVRPPALSTAFTQKANS